MNSTDIMTSLGIVLIHGAATTPRIWRLVSTQLAKRLPGVNITIRMFYSWAIERKLATVDPTAGIPPIATRRAHGKVCPEEAIEKGLGSTNNDARIAVMLGAFCGLRRIEIARINLSKDITDDENGMMLRIHGKGNKERELPVPAKLAGILRKRPKGWLFPGRFSGHCSVDYIAKLIKTATGYPSHTLRRRFATVAYYRNGCNVVWYRECSGMRMPQRPCATSASSPMRCATPSNRPRRQAWASR